MKNSKDYVHLTIIVMIASNKENCLIKCSNLLTHHNTTYMTSVIEVKTTQFLILIQVAKTKQA